MIFTQRKDREMKGFILTMLLAAMLSVSTFGQWTTNAAVERSNSELVVSFVGVLDTVAGTYDSLRSATFSLEDYDGADYFTLYYSFVAPACAPKFHVNLWTSEDNVTFVDHTQIIDTSVSETSTWTAFQMSNTRAKYYQLSMEQVATGRDDVAFTVKIRAIIKDPAVLN